MFDARENSARSLDLRPPGLVVSITPEQPIPLFGRSARSGPFEDLAGDLEANLIALPGERGDVLLIGLDTLFASDRLKAAVIDRLPSAVGSGIAEMVFVASHTHNAPALDPTKPRLGVMDNDYFEQTAETVGRAIGRLSAPGDAPPLQLSRGSSSCAMNALRRRRGLRVQRKLPYVGWSINMLPVHDVRVPRTVELLVARNGEGVPQWAIWQWCCHATSSPLDQRISADFPGQVRAWLRRWFKSPRLPVIVLPGFCGDIRPDPSVLPVSLSSLAMTPLQRPFARATHTNHGRLCAALTRAIGAAVALSSPVGLLPQARAARGRLPLRAMVADTLEVDAGLGMDVVAIAAGPLGLLLLGAEVCSPYIAKLAPLLPAGWLLSGYADQVFGYLPDDSQIAEGGYEADGHFEVFGLTGQFRPRIEGGVVETVQDVVARVRARA